jgi:hypothetical protein
LIAWVDDVIDGNGTGIRMRRFNAAGGGVGAETTVNNVTFSDQSNPDLAIGKDGVVMFVWETADSKGDITGATTDGTPVVITAPNHGLPLSTPLFVNIQGVVGVTATGNINGVHPIVALTGNSFVVQDVNGDPAFPYQTSTTDFWELTDAAGKTRPPRSSKPTTPAGSASPGSAGPTTPPGLRWIPMAAWCCRCIAPTPRACPAA